jgi:hypothetical protein
MMVDHIDDTYIWIASVNDIIKSKKSRRHRGVVQNLSLPEPPQRGPPIIICSVILLLVLFVLLGLTSHLTY